MGRPRPRKCFAHKLHQDGYCLGSSVVRALAHTAKAPGSNPALDTSRSVVENSFNTDLTYNEYNLEYF